MISFHRRRIYALYMGLSSIRRTSDGISVLCFQTDILDKTMEFLKKKTSY